MDTKWLKGHENKEARKKKVLGYRHVLQDLKEILEREYRKKPANRDYSNPNWVASQIAVNEYNQALEDLIKLIDFKE